ncbi:CLUMA_CG003597, isoform A [Clunio marinus]|uniref:CLUMA_CG003597, isoform A n=1 Tax=Clunio marinus TaxID=568069 RepID=A0A1J1HNM3_9DIPT|nr:CLUMA_CG003597, isoform A [Clunio marinus]
MNRKRSNKGGVRDASDLFKGLITTENILKMCLKAKRCEAIETQKREKEKMKTAIDVVSRSQT